MVGVVGGGGFGGHYIFGGGHYVLGGISVALEGQKRYGSAKKLLRRVAEVLA